MPKQEAMDPISAMRALYLEADAYIQLELQSGERREVNGATRVEVPSGLVLTRFDDDNGKNRSVQVNAEYERHSDAALIEVNVTFPAKFPDNGYKGSAAVIERSITANDVNSRVVPRREFPGLVAELRQLLPKEIGDLIGTRSN